MLAAKSKVFVEHLNELRNGAALIEVRVTEGNHHSRFHVHIERLRGYPNPTSEQNIPDRNRFKIFRTALFVLFVEQNPFLKRSVAWLAAGILASNCWAPVKSITARTIGV